MGTCGRRWALGLVAIGCAALGFGSGGGRPAVAVDVAAFESIRTYDVTVAIDRSGLVGVRERITYDFAANPHHGIFRDIPVVFPSYDKDHDRIYRLTDVRVSADPGTPAQFDVSDEGNAKRIKIGDPDRTITGVHTYEITYTVAGALNAFPDHDELYMNAVGTGFSVPIAKATVAVDAPGTITQVNCFAGPAGTSLPCATATAANAHASFAASALGAYSGVTVVVGIPKGAVTPAPAPILRERWSLAKAFTLSPATIGFASLLGVLGLGGVGALLWRSGRDRRAIGEGVAVAFGDTTGGEERVRLFERAGIPVQFEPPDKLRPGQVGTLVDEVANPLDVTATIVDLAVRGYLRIEEIPKEGWFGHADWRLLRTEKATDELLTYERTLLTGLFQTGDTVLLSSLKRTFAPRLAKVQQSLYVDAAERKWFVGRPDKVRAKWHAIGIGALLAGIAIFAALLAKTHAALVGVPLVLIGLVLFLGASRMPRRTPKGVGVLRRALGFREFIEVSEKDRAQFAERANLFSEYLPYAIVFGATEKWAKAFEGLALPPDTSWYVSPHPFLIADFSRSMQSFATTTAGTMAMTAASSGGGASGFSGGFSGGGFGGGGGGSW